MKSKNEQAAKARDILNRTRDSLEYKVESAWLEFTEKMIEHMEQQHITRAMLAARLGTSRPYVTKLLSGESNLTLESMVKVADALDCSFTPQLHPKGQEGVWLSFLVEEPVITASGAEASLTADHQDLALAA